MSNATQPPATGAEAAVVGIAPPGFRMPATLQLGQVSLQVSDMARSLEYYQRVLGLRVVRRSGAEATLAAHGDDTPLVVLRERPGVQPVPRRGLLGLYHFAILLPDRAALGRFIAHLAQLGERAGASDHLVSEALYLRDPDGLGIEVYADRPRSGWRAVDGQIVMATEPLDLAAVVAEARGESWTGMPAGTRMGHVHLHVGDIEEASRFYHEALGLDRMVWSYPGALFLAAGGYHHHLGLNTWAGPGARPAGEVDARLLEWRISLPASHAIRARASLESAGREVTPTADGFRVTDPWGTALVVAADHRDEPA
jgi:catechol 2,3-dioxygenase